MRFLHLADLHLGKVLHQHSLIADQADILQKIYQIAKEQRVDAVLIAGDVYQRSAPAAEAMTLFSDFLAQFSAAGIPCYIISGNHDSAERVAYLAPLAQQAGVFLSGSEPGKFYTHTVADDLGEITLHLLPYTAPLHVRALYPEEADGIQTYEDAFRVLTAHHPVEPHTRNVLIAHQYLTGAQTCDSEELAIGGQDNISAALFDDYDYVALGHLHGSQKVGRAEVRYAGSPLKYSFSELRQQKSVTVVELREKGSVSVELIPLTPLHEMRAVSGSFAELMALPESEDYMELTVTDDAPPADAARQLRTVFPNLLHTLFRSEKFRESRGTEAEISPEQTDFSALLRDFYAFVNNGAEMSPEQDAIVSRLLDRLTES